MSDLPKGQGPGGGCFTVFAAVRHIAEAKRGPPGRACKPWRLRAVDHGSDDVHGHLHVTEWLIAGRLSKLERVPGARPQTDQFRPASAPISARWVSPSQTRASPDQIARSCSRYALNSGSESWAS